MVERIFVSNNIRNIVNALVPDGCHNTNFDIISGTRACHQHIWRDTKWLLFCKHFQINFSERKYRYLDFSFTEIYSHKSNIDNALWSAKNITIVNNQEHLEIPMPHSQYHKGGWPCSVRCQDICKCTNSQVRICNRLAAEFRYWTLRKTSDNVW